MKRMRSMAAMAACVLLSGCYHQVVNTGLPAGSTVVTKKWHPSWFFGLVPGAPIDVRQQCPSGVAMVSTRMTFLNGLVAGFLGIIIVPHEVTVTCSSRSAMLPGQSQRSIADGATTEQAGAILNDAAKAAAASGTAVAITFAPAAAGAR
jgi:hypothetical protein